MNDNCWQRMVMHVRYNRTVSYLVVNDTCIDNGTGR